MTVDYIGEHLLPGKIGNSFVIISFVFALMSSVSYFISARNKDDLQWKLLGRLSFFIHAFGVIGIVATLFYMLANQMYEYHYVWQHSNSEMPMRYIFSCFWEGQEGSFLLWTFWHVILGVLLVFTAKKWETTTMTVFASVQFFLTSMLLGIYIGDHNIGSSPFNILLREHPDFANIPLFANADYLSKLDGRGLNPLLQNYWMTIHPPTLFLGFASTLIPFCFAIAGLWKRQYIEWLKPALPWTYFGVGILGLGILMGGAWAYEALSFGGFWAWDPVENASLVPWLTFVGAAHVMIIHKNKGTSLFLAFFLTIITFILILYSTFLTRSGILGESSVHAFTDLGLAGQLLVYLLSYFVFSFVLLIANSKRIPKSAKEEEVWSREFWMLIGAIVLFFASVIILFTTSYPVINKLFGTSMAPPINVIDHYHRSQIPIAIIVTLIMGYGQFLKYKKTEFKAFLKAILFPLSVSVLITIPIVFFLKIQNYFYPVLLFTSIFSVTANLDYLLRIVKGKISKGGASIAHIGFGLILLGALVSTSQQDVISSNTTNIDITQLGDQFTNHENTLLYRDDTIKMGAYHVAYRGKKKEGVNIYYQVDYMERNEAGVFSTAFTLFPTVQINPRMGNVSEPDTRHYFDKDIYTHVTYAELEDRYVEEENAYLEPQSQKMAVGDTLFSSNAMIVLEAFNRALLNTQLGLNDSDIAVGAQLKVLTMDGKSYLAQPIYILKDKSYVYSMPDEIEEVGLKFNFDKILPLENKIEISFAEKKSNSREFIILKAIIFPYINILWIGSVLMVIGSIIAVVNRVRTTKN